MRILHTSDWHLGRTLYGRQRYDEFAAFLDWLAALIEREGVTALLVAGDVFDTSTPTHRAQELYYRFLCRVARSSCRHLVVVAGNHDSPTFLEAPKELLRALDVHVIGSAAENPADEVLVLRDPAGTPELIVCAVPYLRDRDIRRVEAGEDGADKELKLVAGIRDHYASVIALAEARRAELGAEIPLVAMGHLFTAGGRTLEGDGVRELYIGSLAHVSPGIFPDSLDYLALGHLHVPQQIGGAETRRYSGSPLPMGFGEARQEKSLCLVEWEGNKAEAEGPTTTTATRTGADPGVAMETDARLDGDPGTAGIRIREKGDRPGCRVRLIPIPVFQPLERIQGDWDRLAERLKELVAARSPTWIEVIYEGEALIGDLRERLEALLAIPEEIPTRETGCSRVNELRGAEESATREETATRPEILRVRNNRLVQGVLERMHEEESLGDLDELEVFARCLEAQGVGAEQQADLLRAYREILATFHQADPLAK